VVLLLVAAWPALAPCIGKGNLTIGIQQLSLSHGCMSLAIEVAAATVCCQGDISIRSHRAETKVLIVAWRNAAIDGSRYSPDCMHHVSG
jgi:hypothetical protein